jgi:hypothetical protein
MQQPRIKPMTRSLQPPLRTIQVTDAELIVIQAALSHYLEFLRASNPDLYQQAAPHVSQLINRLHDQLPPRKDRIEGP